VASKKAAFFDVKSVTPTLLICVRFSFLTGAVHHVALISMFHCRLSEQASQMFTFIPLFINNSLLSATLLPKASNLVSFLAAELPQFGGDK
jgi:hypothetical protein